MKAKDRITLVLVCKATGTHKIPIAIIGKPQQPLCFMPPRRPCPLPYFSQKSAWMDADIFKFWFETVFLPAVRARTTQPVVLVSDNCGAHGDLECEQVKFLALPPNCTSVYQPLDLGIIACLKRRYKRRLSDLVVGAFDATIDFRASAGAPDAMDGPERAADVAGAPDTSPTTNRTAGSVIDGGESKGGPTGLVHTGEAAIEVTSGGALRVHRWLSQDGSWPTINDQPPEALGAASIAARGAERRAARLAVRRAARSAERRAARIAVQRAARSAERRAARIAVRPAARNATRLPENGSASLAAAGSGIGRNPSAVVGGPGIWGWPSDWPAAPDSTPPKCRRSSTRSARVEIRGVRDGAGAHLQDASEIVQEEWEAVEPCTIAHCWVKSTNLPHALATTVTALHGEYRASSRELGDDVNAVVSLMGDCRFGLQAFANTPTPAREMAVQDWLSMEDDEGVLAATADEIAFAGGARGIDMEGGGSEDEESEDSSDSTDSDGEESEDPSDPSDPEHE